LSGYREKGSHNTQGKLFRAIVDENFWGF
jgi:hypothetical protein